MGQPGSKERKRVVYPAGTLLPMGPTSIWIEFGSLRKSLVTPVRKFRTVDDLRGWILSQCGGNWTPGSPVRLEIYDRNTSSFVAMSDLSDLLEKSWFRLTVVSSPGPTPPSSSPASAASKFMSRASVATTTVEKFAKVSKSELRFVDSGDSTFTTVGSDATERFTITSVTDVPAMFDVSMITESKKFKLTFNPSSGELAPMSSTIITATFSATCTTTVAAVVAVCVASREAKERQVTTISVRSVTQPTMRIDFDEVTLLQPPVGSGTSGTVYRGTWRGQEVACKVMTAQEDVAPFEKEVEIFEQLRSPFIVTFIGASHIPTKLCMLTEYFNLGSVLTAMSRKKFSWPLKNKCMLDCSRGMRYLHATGIMHRDLKPDNLMLVTMSVDSQINVKITDFGSTRAIGALNLGLKTAGVGTPAYMSPEVLGSKPYGPSTDVYSFGMMIWFFIAEYQPFTKGTEFETIWAVSDFVLKGKRPPVPEGAPEPLVTLMERCYDQAPSNRPTFAMITEALEPVFAASVSEHHQRRSKKK